MPEVLCLGSQHSQEQRMRLEKTVPSSKCGGGCASQQDSGTLPMDTCKFPSLSQSSCLVLPTLTFVCPYILASEFFCTTWSSPLCLAPGYSITLSLLPRSPVSLGDSQEQPPFFCLPETPSLVSFTSFCVSICHCCLSPLWWSYVCRTHKSIFQESLGMALSSIYSQNIC